MSVSQEQLETLKQKIIKAFADVPYPKGVIAPHECDECREVRKNFANKNWKTIEPKILEENYDKLPLFSPEAFHYFIPAYLIYSLAQFEGYFNEVPEFTIYALTPSKEIKERADWWQERFSGFTFEQFELICEFLDLAKENEGFENFYTIIERGKERLKEFVEPIIRK